MTSYYYVKKLPEGITHFNLQNYLDGSDIQFCGHLFHGATFFTKKMSQEKLKEKITMMFIAILNDFPISWEDYE